MTRLDLHTHLAPPLPDYEAGPPVLRRPAALEEWLDGVGLDRAVVSLPPPYFRQGQDAAATAAWVRSVNDGLVAMLAAHPRLSPIAYLPLDQPEIALAEVARWQQAGGVVGFSASAGGSSCSLAAPELAPLWAALEALDAFVLLHPGESPDARLDDFYLANLLGNPVETAVAAAQLLLGDVLGRHPRLRVMLVHCGGVVPSVLARWQQGVDTERPGMVPLSVPLEQAVRGIWVDALAHAPGVVRAAVETFGADRIVLGSDWPFPMGLADPVAELARAVPELVEAAATAQPAALLGTFGQAATRPCSTL